MDAAPLELAQRLAPLLRDLDWAIGGSTLLHRLGIETEPRDLDLVTSIDHFAGVTAVLGRELSPVAVDRHPHYVSRGFSRFVSTDGVTVEVMADIAVRGETGIVRWHFDPARVEWVDGLPWMQPVDWLHLYRLFDRPARVAQLEAWFASR